MAVRWYNVKPLQTVYGPCILTRAVVSNAELNVFSDCVLLSFLSNHTYHI